MTDVNQLTTEYHSTLKRMQGLRTQLAQLGALEKDENFTGLYTWVIRELNTARDRQGLLILLELGNHADELGWCYPSLKRLGTMTGYDHARHSTVEQALDRLMARDWVRVMATKHPRRKRVETDLMLSPAVLYIRPELREQAWAAYNALPKCNSYEQAVTNLVKPYTEPESEPTPQPKPSTRTTTNTTNTPEGLTPVRPPSEKIVVFTPSEANPSAESASSEANPSAESASSEAHPAEPGKTPPPVAPPPPRLPDGVDLAQPLPDPADEAAAQALKRDMPSLKIRYARRYIALYGRDLVAAAAHHALTSPHVRSAVGVMDYALRQRLADQSDPTKKRGYADGEDAAWFDNWLPQEEAN